MVNVQDYDIVVSDFDIRSIKNIHLIEQMTQKVYDWSGSLFYSTAYHVEEVHVV